MTDPYDTWLADAVEAARDVARDDAPAAREGAATRARIHASLEARRGTSKRRLTLISAVLASLFGSTAFAYYSGWRPFARPATPPSVIPASPPPPALVDRVRRTPTAASPTPTPLPTAASPSPPPMPTAASPNPSPPPMPTPMTANPPPMPTAANPTPTSTSTSMVASSTTGASPMPTPTPTAAGPTPTPTMSPAPSSVTATSEAARASAPAEAPRAQPAAEAAPDAELAAYQEAHAAHFRGTDAAAALAAWDRYLARFPDGKLAPEARYDRAIALVKLARWADARAALAPFASAPAGSYRQREATQILDAIRGR